MSYSDILRLDKQDNGVALLTLNRPGQRNALSQALRTDLTACLVELDKDKTVEAVIITGNGDVFCAGFDLKELSQGDQKAIFTEAQIYHRAVHTFTKPTIAAVNGPAMAGGMDLAFMCDVRLGCYMSEFGQPQIRMGIPASYDLMRSVTGESVVRYLCLTGNTLNAQEALSSGIISELYDDHEQLLNAALACAEEIAKSRVGPAMKTRFLSEQPKLYE